MKENNRAVKLFCSQKASRLLKNLNLCGNITKNLSVIATELLFTPFSQQVLGGLSLHGDGCKEVQ